VNPTNYQVYSIEWNSDEIRWFLNGNQYHYLSIANNTQSTDEFHLPFYLILNLAVGGNWPGYPDATTSFPAQLEIDYVRAYKLDEEASLPETEVTEISVSPNPAINQITVESSIEGNVIISTMDGSVVSEEKLTSGSNNLSIENLAVGMYLMTIQHENGSISKVRFIKN
jgi:beta-glucanase (GH16 family)